MEHRSLIKSPSLPPGLFQAKAVNANEVVTLVTTGFIPSKSSQRGGHIGQDPAERGVEWNFPSSKERFESTGSRTAKTKVKAAGNPQRPLRDGVEGGAPLEARLHKDLEPFGLNLPHARVPVVHRRCCINTAVTPRADVCCINIKGSAMTMHLCSGVRASTMRTSTKRSLSELMHQAQRKN
jgi:hypothetical protein